MRVKKLRAAVCCLLAACTGGLFADEVEDVSGGDPAPAEPVFGRVFGMYCLNKEAGQTPVFPFRAQWQVNPSSTKTSGSNASPDTSNLSAEDLASLPTNAFTRTGYVHTNEQEDNEFDVFNVLNLTPGATYRMDVYLNEPWDDCGRAQYVCINDENVKNASGADVKLIPFEDCGGKTKVGKFSYDVVAKADGTLSFAFPRASNQSVLNVVTLAGTNGPAAVTAPMFKSNGKTNEVELHWPLSRDAFAYYVQQQMDGGAWETVAETTETNVVLTLPAKATQKLDYRVVSSNGLGVAEGTVVSYGIRRRARYAVGLGLTAPAGRFVPADAVLTSCVMPDLTKVAAPFGVEGQYAADRDVYMNYAWGVDNKMAFAFSNLTANAAYAFRIHFIEGSGTADTNQTRLIDVSTNGALAQMSYDALAACGYRKYGVGYLDMTSAADANGTLTLAFTNTAGSTFTGLSACAVEVFAREEEPFASEVPALVVTAFAEGARIVPETRHAQNVYEIRYVDYVDAATVPAETVEGTCLVTNVPVAGFFDFDVPETGTRWYRVRAVAEDGAHSAWSPWTGAARGGRAFSAALRVNFTEDDIQPPDGWVNDRPFRAGHVGAFTQSPKSTNAFEVPQNVIPDQAPDLVYLTGIVGLSATETDKQTYRFVFPGFDSARTYRLRLHLVENYFDTIGKRTFRLAVNRLARDEWRGIDSLKLANGVTNCPSVFEATVTPALDGTIRMDILREKENPTLRGVEFIPVESEGETFGPGRVAFLRDAGANAIAGSNETCVAEADADPLAWSWTATNVPADAGDQPRILAHGRFYAPQTDLYTAEVTKDADGTFDLWVDGQVFAVNTAVELAVGSHDVYMSYRPANRASCAAKLTWRTASGSLPRALRTDVSLAYPDGWHFAQIGPHAAPAFLQRTTSGAWKMAASGNDMWGGTDCATFLYHAAGRGTFDCSFRVTGLGGTHTSHTRLGVMVRSSLESAKADAFMLYAGLNGDRKYLRAYQDADPGDGTFNIVKGFDVAAGACTNFPFTVRAVRTREGVNDRFVLSFTAADGTLVHAETQDVARAANVYVGPVAVAHEYIGKALTHYEFADLEFEDTTPRALVIIVR